MRTTIFTALALVLAAGHAQAQDRDPGPNAPVSYEVAFPNAAHHEARITVTYRDLPAGPVTFRMARSSPGRYAIHEFAKNVYSVSAKNGAGAALPIERDDPYSWIVPSHDGTVSVTYTLFADRADGTYSQVDTSHAHLNMPATFLWAEGYEDRPIRVRFQPLSSDWKIATQLPPVDGEANVFWAPHLQYFMDSPTELADFDLREWQVGNQTIRLAVHHLGTEAEVDRFAEMAKKVVAAQIAVWGEAPQYDFGTYTFIADYLPWVSGDGMEHRNSTIISNTRGLAEANYSQLGTLSHEFIHSWNVERLRPAELEPFDFTHANPTPSLWFAEGFTSYYGPLAIRRAGESSVDEFLGEMGGTLGYILTAPGRAYGSPQEMSLRAPFVDAATAIDPTNPNIFTSYYPYGAVIGMALDLTLRQRGLTLDGYMRHMWERNGRAQADYMPVDPYSPEDLEAGLAEFTRDAAFAAQFFGDYVRDSKLPDFAPLLAQAGMVLRPRSEGRPWIGEQALRPQDGALVVASPPPPASPLYAAGLDRGAVITRLGETAITAPSDLAGVLRAAKPGDTLAVAFTERGMERTAQLTVAADPSLEVVRTEAAGGTLSEAQRAFREAWLGSE